MACWSDSSPAGCISIRVAATLSVMRDNLSLPSSRSMVGVLLMDLRSWVGICLELYIIICNCLPLMLTWVNVLLVLVCRCKHSSWLKNMKWLN
jgi:hypothetical protein